MAEQNVGFAIIGGYAMRFYGCNRFAKDLDLLIGYDAKNIEKIIPVISSYGTVQSDEIRSRLSKRNVYVPIDGIEIDLFTSVKGIELSTIIKNAIEAPINGLKVLVISAYDLYKSKKAAARPEDLEDINFLEKYCLVNTAFIEQ